jgi:histidinol-phosphate/aromatic aminotransferase/cobyric acid decarboxylase-like protein
LAGAAGVSVFPSVANFLMLEVEAEITPGKFGAHMFSHGIALRDLRTMPGCKVGLYRVGVRNREDNERLVNEAGKWRK